MISVWKKPDNNNNLEFFALKSTYIIIKFSKSHKWWYLDFYALKNMKGNKDVFKNLIFLIWDFTITRKEIIWLKKLE